MAAGRLAHQAVPGCFRGSLGGFCSFFPITRLDEAGMLLREAKVNTDWLEKVRARAHAIWESLGRPEGAAERHWAQAEEELQAGGGGTASPGDDAPPGTPGTGEDLCPVCNGSGRVDGGTCPNCSGAGKVVAGIGGA